MPTHLLLKGATLWGLKSIYNPPEAGLQTLKERGVSVLEVSDSELTPELLTKIQRYQFGVVVQAYPDSAENFDETLQLARTSRARAINVHAATPHISEDEAVQLISGLIEKSGAAKIPLYFETHRGRITQDLFRTAMLAQRVPQMRFTLDVSHYVLAEERPGPTERLASLLDVILDQTEMIHGRVSNGQQIQVHTIDKNSEIAENYRKLWAEAMRRWRLRNKPGSSLIFTPELGPPPYAIVDEKGKELSNRLEQSEAIWELAQLAWKASAAAENTSCWP